MYNDIYMLWLSANVAHIGSRKINSLLEIYGTARDIFNEKPENLAQTARLSPNTAKTFASTQSLQYIENLLEEMQTKGIAYFPRGHERFPALLAEISDPPAGIFCIGELPPDNTHKIAVIGSRKCSEYGISVAKILSAPLAAEGVVIVSGMAKGIDSAAHREALKAGGKTIAVLGCGVDICYPSENTHLREEIIKNGCVISEYPPGTKPLPQFFPARNRIISGISLGVVVAEASTKSGTLITVEQALDQGREVFTVPGNIISRLSEGTNRLLTEGATPVTTHTDILEALGIPLKTSPAQKPTKIELAQDEKQVYDSLNFSPRSLEAIAEQTGEEISRILFICTRLEIKGLAQKLPGNRFIKGVL